MPRIKFNSVEPVSARVFCRTMFNMNHLSLDEVSELETEPGYRSECVALLAKATHKTKRAVRSWGRGIKFEGMPPAVGLTLAYALLAEEAKSAHRVA